MISKYLSEYSIDIKESVKSVEEAIEVCGVQLIEGGFINEEYIHSMQETYKEFGPYMVLIDKVALFHGKPGVGVLKTGLCLTKLNEPLKIKDSEKQLQLCFAFSSINHSDHMELIQSFAYLLMDDRKISRLLQSNSVDEIISIINKEERE